MAYNKPAVAIDTTVKKSRINLVGIELEGAWAKLPKGVTWVGRNYPKWNEIGRDGSLDPFAARHPEYEIIGELPSAPIKEADVESWITANYPTLIEKECGLHVHISLNDPMTYMRLMDESYPATVIVNLLKWATAEKFATDNPVWERLAGNSIYCQHVYMPDEQVKNTRKDYEKSRPGHRYTAINYAYGRETGTIECRVLPMCNDVAQAIRGAKEFLSITNRYLVATAAREKVYRSRIDVDTAVSRETLVVSV